MRTKLFTRLAALALLILLLTFTVPAAFAAGESSPAATNPETGFSVYILDDDNLLTPEEENALQADMYPITEFGSIVFWSTSEPTGGKEEELAWRKREAVAGKESGIFMINMDDRVITFQSDGRIYECMTRSFARSVTSNVKGFATRGDYYRCAAEAFHQAYDVLQGNRIAQPMKYTSYALISGMLGLLLAALYVFGKKQNTVYKKRETPLSAAVSSSLLGETMPQFLLTGQNRRYSPPSSSSGGHGGGRGGGGGGGGHGGGGSAHF